MFVYPQISYNFFTERKVSVIFYHLTSIFKSKSIGEVIGLPCCTIHEKNCQYFLEQRNIPSALEHKNVHTLNLFSKLQPARQGRTSFLF